MTDLFELERLAAKALSLWDLDGAVLRMLNHSENTTFLVAAEVGTLPYVMRVHRPGYHTHRGVRSELAWTHALKAETGIKTPQAVAGRDGELIQVVHSNLPEPRMCVLFEFIEGAEPDQARLIEPFKQLGEVTARMQAHGKSWARPTYFQRPTWDFEHCLGSAAYWGSWRDGANVDRTGRKVLARAVDAIEKQLQRFGKSSDRYGLVHADIRLANLLVHDGETRVIDFDDCGDGWFLYDAATAVSFIEDRSDIDELAAAWLEGYRRAGAIAAADEKELWTFIMMRRFGLLAWLGSHAETATAQELAPHYGPRSLDLAESYLSKFA